MPEKESKNIIVIQVKQGYIYTCLGLVQNRLKNFLQRSYLANQVTKI